MHSSILCLAVFVVCVLSRAGCRPGPMAPAKDGMAAGYAGLSDDEDETEEAVLATPTTGLPKRGSGVFNGGAQDMAQQSLDDLAALFQTAFNELRNPHLANPVEVARKLRERVKSGASTRARACSKGPKGRTSARPLDAAQLRPSRSASCPLRAEALPVLLSDGGEHPPRQEEGGRVRNH